MTSSIFVKLLLSAVLLTPMALYSQDSTIKDVEYRKQCLDIKQYIVKGAYQAECFYNYHQFNALKASGQSYYSSSLASQKGKITVAGYNMWLPGQDKTIFKDYRILAQAVNQYDVVGALELMAVLGRDLVNNDAVKKFLTDGPRLLAAATAKVTETEAKIKRYELSTSQYYKDLTAKAKLELKSNIAARDLLLSDISRAPTLFRGPGYLKLLDELRKLDPSWALILSPKGQAAEETNVQELAGFYYRASIVNPKVNSYCLDVKTAGHGTPAACIPDFKTPFMDQDYNSVFSRRPFMASFESGKFDFTLLTAHVVFTSDPTKMANIMKLAFGVDDYTTLSTGINKENFARFAEANVTLKFIEKMRSKYSEQDVIYVGDFNLEASNKFFVEMMKTHPGLSLLVTEATSIAESTGYSSNYDHFILDPVQTNECDPKTAKRADVIYGAIGDIIRGTYDDSLKQDWLDWYEATLNAEETIKRDQIVKDDLVIAKRMEDFERRVFDSQSVASTKFLLYREILSDHTSIMMSCSTK